MSEKPDYSSLYGSSAETSTDSEPTAENGEQETLSFEQRERELALYEQRELARKGKIKVRIIGIIYLIIIGLSSLGSIFNFSQGVAYWVGAMAASILFIAVGVQFLRGKNSARIVLGIFFIIRLLLSLTILIPSFIVSAKQGMGVVIIGAVMSLPTLAFNLALIWFTLFNKSVKIYCKSKNQIKK